MNEQLDVKKSPEKRTAEFFEQNLNNLGDDLIKGDGMIIALPNSDRKIRITEIDEYPKSTVGQRYKKAGIDNMNPGDLWNPPVRSIAQSLIVARDKNGVGACVRLLKAEYWDPSIGKFVADLTKGEYKFTAKEKDIAKYLGLEKSEKSRLKFLDDSNILYVIRSQS